MSVYDFIHTGLSKIISMKIHHATQTHDEFSSFCMVLSSEILLTRNYKSIKLMG